MWSWESWEPAIPGLAVSASATQFTFASGGHRAPEARSLDCSRAGATGCPGCIVEKAISGRLSLPDSMDHAPDSA